MISEEDYTELVSIRRHLHQLAELSGEEFETSRFIADYLEKHAAGYLTQLSETGILWTIDSGNEGLKVLLRAELDALPIAEVNTFDHKSRTPGVSHKCGHDGHMVILIGVILSLSRNPPGHGVYQFLFQPAEETGVGAKQILESEEFKIQPDYVFALHNLPGFQDSAVVYKSGTFNAAVTSLEIKLIGKTAHAAEPENGINPAMAISEILRGVNKLIVTSTSQSNFGLITPVHVKMGEKSYGVSAGEGEIHFTLRAWTNEQLEKLKAQVVDLVTLTANDHQLQSSFIWKESFAASTNDEGATAIVERSANDLGLMKMRKQHPFKWGEDFGLFTKKFKGAIFGLGAGENTPALHNPDYDFPDQLLRTGVSMFLRIIEEVNIRRRD
ncbi:MAG: amidohydrolase [Bacteroidota bacterium]